MTQYFISSRQKAVEIFHLKFWELLWKLDIKIDELVYYTILFLRTGVLSGRQGCVIESALNSNKHRVVWVLLAGANSTR